MILELGFVLLTPIEQLWPSLASCPTKSSLRKFMLSLGFMWTPFSTMCMNVWNLKTMLNSSRPFDKAHLLRLSYDRKNLWARFILLSNSWGLRNLPPSSYRSIKRHKLSKASGIWHSSTLVLSTISLRMGIFSTVGFQFRGILMWLLWVHYHPQRQIGEPCGSAVPFVDRLDFYKKHGWSVWWWHLLFPLTLMIEKMMENGSTEVAAKPLAKQGV